jgi:hypothetical protein
MAIEQAEGIVSQLALDAAPIDPARVADSESPILIVKSGDYRDRFDGQLEYHRGKNRFLLFYNTKYGRPPSGERHPRTRFSFAHELGHYFIERHRAYLMRGAPPHGSKSEFLLDVTLEREADAFASGLLMPAQLMRREVNQGELTLQRLEGIADTFNTSLLSTTIRGVQLSDFPCAVVAARDACVAWSFLSPSLKEAGCYPLPAGSPLPSSGKRLWDELTKGSRPPYQRDGMLTEWFRTYDKEDLFGVLVHLEATWISSMETFLMLLTADENDLIVQEEEGDL